MCDLGLKTSKKLYTNLIVQLFLEMWLGTLVGVVNEDDCKLP